LARLISSDFLLGFDWFYGIQQAIQIANVLWFLRFQSDAIIPTMRLEYGRHFLESVFGLHVNNGGVLFSTQLPCLFSTEHVGPVTGINTTFHPANIRDSISHEFIIPPLAGLSYRMISAAGVVVTPCFALPSSRRTDQRCQVDGNME
jgi:hypothetical protein